MLRAILFDLNGTLSDDEEIYFDVYRELLAERGVELDRAEYYRSFVGHADETIFRTALDVPDDELDRLVRERVELYSARVASGDTVPESARSAVRAAARRVTVGVVTGAFRTEAQALLAAAELLGEITFLVAAEDVERPKPHPDAYLAALRLLGDVDPRRVVVFEDTPAGVEAAKGAGLRVVAVAGTLPPGRLAAADEVVERLEEGVVERILDGS